MKMLNSLPEVKIAITGPIGIGKSTIVNTLLTYLGEKPLGFRTLPVIKNNALYSFEIVNLYTFEVLKSKKFVLYVVKEELNEFLKKALSMANLVFQVSKDNRDTLYKKILGEIWVYTKIS